MDSKKKNLTRNKSRVVGSRKQQTKRNERDAISSFMLMEKSANRITPTVIFDPKAEHFSAVE